MSRRRAKAGAPIGLFANDLVEVRPLDGKERAALAEAVGGQGSGKAGTTALDEALQWAMTSFVRQRLADPDLPTEREVARGYASLADRIDAVWHPPGKGRQVAVDGVVKNVAATVHLLEYCGEIDEHLRQAAACARAKAADLEMKAAAQVKRPPAAAHALFANIRRLVGAAGLSSALPTDSAADTAPDRPFFKTARALLAASKLRFDEAAKVGVPGAVSASEETDRLIGLSPKAFMKHLRASSAKPKTGDESAARHLPRARPAIRSPARLRSSRGSGD